MSDESSKTMMVDERQSVRQVLDSLLDKSHCGYSPDWSLVETINELQMGEGGAACHAALFTYTYRCFDDPTYSSVLAYTCTTHIKLY